MSLVNGIVKERGLLCRPWGVSSTSSSRTGEEALCSYFCLAPASPKQCVQLPAMQLMSGAHLRLLDKGLSVEEKH